MGIEFTDITVEQLEDLLYDTSGENTEDLSTFVDSLYDMYGGIDESAFESLISFINVELGIKSDAQLKAAEPAIKEKIVEYMAEK